MNKPSPKEPLIAALFSIIASGTGQLYCGHRERALFFFLFPCGFALAAFGLTLLPSTRFPLDLPQSFGIVAAIIFTSSLDAFFCARRYNQRLKLRPLSGILHNLAGILTIAFFFLVSNPAHIILYAIRANAIKCYDVSGNSFTPKLIDKDKVLVNKLAYRKALPLPEDIILIKQKSGKAFYQSGQLKTIDPSNIIGRAYKIYFPYKRSGRI